MQRKKWELANEKIRELFRNTKLNIKFTSIIILFMVIPIGVLAGFCSMLWSRMRCRRTWITWNIQCAE